MWAGAGPCRLPQTPASSAPSQGGGRLPSVPWAAVAPLRSVCFSLSLLSRGPGSFSGRLGARPAFPAQHCCCSEARSREGGCGAPGLRAALLRPGGPGVPQRAFQTAQSQEPISSCDIPLPETRPRPRAVCRTGVGGGHLCGRRQSSGATAAWLPAGRTWEPGAHSRC